MPIARPNRNHRRGRQSPLGPIGRLGRWTATHFATVVAAWAVVAVGLGLFAPRVEQALSGAGWQATGSESVRARALIDRHFDGLGSYGPAVVVPSLRKTVSDPPVRHAVRGAEARLKRDPAVSTVVAPRAGASISADRHTVVIRAGAARDADAMVRAADELKGPLSNLGSDGVHVNLTGAAGMWSDFNQANRSAM